MRKFIGILSTLPKFPRSRGGKIRFVSFLLFECLAILFFIDFLLVRQTVFQYDLEPASSYYYAHMPVTDPIVVQLYGIGNSFMNWQQSIHVTDNIPVSVVFMAHQNRILIRPKEGVWPKGKDITLTLEPTRTPLHQWLNTLLRRLNIKPQTGKNLSFTTASAFTVINASHPNTPFDAMILQFSYKLKDPTSLINSLDIDPDVGVKVEEKQMQNGREQGAVYTIYFDRLTYKTSYVLTVKPGIVSELNEALIQPYTIPFTTQKNPNEPEIIIGRENKDWKLINGNPETQIRLPVYLKHLNQARLSIYPVSVAETINFFTYKAKTEQYWDKWSRALTNRISVASKKSLWEGNVETGYQILQLPVLQPGTYVLDIPYQNNGEQTSRQAIISISSLAAVGAVTENQGIYFVTNRMTGRGINQATIRLYNLQNGAKILNEITTSDRGLATSVNSNRTDLGVVFANNQTTFIPLDIGIDSLQGTNSNEWYVQYPLPDEQLYKGYIILDRPLYKPGDTIQSNIIVREDNDAQYGIPKQRSFTVELLKDYWAQNSRPILQQQIQLSDMGTGAFSFAIPPVGVSGDFYVVLKQDQQIITSKKLEISDYRKPLYHMELSLDKETYYSNDRMKAEIQVETSFGTPAGNTMVTWYLKQGWSYGTSETDDPYSISKQWSYDGGWDWWDYQGYYGGQTVTSGTITLDAKGRGTIDHDLGETIKHRRGLILEAVIEDEAGIPEAARAFADYSPSAYRLDIIEYKYTLEQPGVVAKLVNEAGKAIPQATITLTNGPKDTPSVLTDANGMFSITYPAAKVEFASYTPTLEWKDDQGRKETLQVSVYAYGLKRRQETVDDPLEVPVQEATVTFPDNVSLNQTVQYTVSNGGEDHLVVFAREKSYDVRVVRENEPTTYIINEAWYPNGVLFSASFKGGSLVASTTTVQPKHVEDFKRVVLTVTPEKEVYLPGEQATFSITTTTVDGTPVSSEVTLSAVDRSIYDLVAAQDKPIHPYFYHKRRTRLVFSHSLRGFTLYSYGGKGGGGGGSPQVRENLADTAFFLPAIRTDETGKATVTVTLPDTLTTWILSGYTVSQNTQVGQTTAEFVTKKPLSVFPVVPSFLILGDKITVSSIIRNTTTSGWSGVVSAALDSLAPDKQPTQQLNLSSQLTQTLRWPFTIQGNPGQRTFSFLASSNGALSDGVTLPVSVLPKQVDIPTRSSGIGSAIVQARVLDGAMADQSTAELRFSSGISAQLLDVLVYQVGYPYGCIEQTMSRFYPTVLLTRFDSQILDTYKDLFPNPRELITSGIRHLSYLQHADGGWGLWEQDRSTVFNTSYVLRSLHVVKDSYPVPSRMLLDAQAFLEEPTRVKGYTTDEKIIALGSLVDLKSRTVASLAAQLQPSAVDMSRLDDEQVARLAHSFVTIKHPDSKQFIEELERRAIRQSDATVSWKAGTSSISHPHENLSTAFALKALLGFDKKHPLISPAVRFLFARKNIQMYGSTYTNAQVTEALLEYAKVHQEVGTAFNLIVKSDGKELYRQRVSHPSFRGSVTIPFAKPVEIEVTDDGLLLWDLVVQNTFDSLPQGRESNNFSLQRSYTNLTRKDGTTKPGDIIEVTLQITNKTSSRKQNVVVEDPLPAGFEIINKQFQNETGVNSQGGYSWYPQEIYDHKMVIFPWGIEGGSTQKVTYHARVIHPGTFTALPAFVQSMYEDDLPAFGTMDIVTVLE